MKLRYRLLRRRNGLFLLEDTVSKKQESLRTRDQTTAPRLFGARNEAHQQLAIDHVEKRLQNAGFDGVAEFIFDLEEAACGTEPFDALLRSLVVVILDPELIR